MSDYSKAFCTFGSKGKFCGVRADGTLPPVEYPNKPLAQLREGFQPSQKGAGETIIELRTRIQALEMRLDNLKINKPKGDRL